MKCEIPEYARCCFCFPLRFGLLLWVYVKLVLSLLLLTNLIGIIVRHFTDDVYHDRFNFMTIYTIIYSILSCVDIAFHIIFIVSAHTKEYRKMKWFYREATVALGVYVFILFFYTFYVFYEFYYSLMHINLTMWILMMIWSMFFCIMISQAYLIILVRSEALKLERSTKFEFTNRAVEAEAMCNNDIVA